MVVGASVGRDPDVLGEAPNIAARLHLSLVLRPCTIGGSILKGSKIRVSLADWQNFAAIAAPASLGAVSRPNEGPIQPGSLIVCSLRICELPEDAAIETRWPRRVRLLIQKHDASSKSLVRHPVQPQ
jgi:hypothetical protein